MTEKKRPRSKRKVPEYPRAVNVTLYDPQGAPVPPSVLEEAANLLTSLAKDHQLLIATATS